MLTIKQITDDKEAVIRGLEKKHFKNAREAVLKPNVPWPDIINFKSWNFQIVELK